MGTDCYVRKESFPFDWVAPGEFTYDSTGEYLCLGPVYRRRFWAGYRAEWLRWAIATARKRLLKYPALWWMRNWRETRDGK